MTKVGKLIVIEGSCDGIGKTTQYNMLKERLIKDGYEVITHHFPSYNTAQGKLVEEYLSGNLGDKAQLSPYFVAELYAVDRAVTWNTELKAEYEQGKVILLDRYTTSTLFYQSAYLDNKKEVTKFVDYVTDHEYNKLGIKTPDLVIFLTAPYDLVKELRSKRTDNEGIINDIHERDNTFMKKVYDNSLYVADYQKWNVIHCDENNEMRSIEDIHEDVYKLVKKM